MVMGESGSAPSVNASVIKPLNPDMIRVQPQRVVSLLHQLTLM